MLHFLLLTKNDRVTGVTEFSNQQLFIKKLVTYRHLLNFTILFAA